MLGSSATTLTSQHQDKQLLVDLRRKIEKSVQLVTSDGILSLKEILSDCLSALSSIQLTPDLIKELKLGNIISSLKDKLETVSGDKSANEAVCSAAEILSSSCKTILLSWKRIIEASKQQQKARSSISNKELKPSIPPATVAVVGDNEKSSSSSIANTNIKEPDNSSSVSIPSIAKSSNSGGDISTDMVTSAAPSGSSASYVGDSTMSISRKQVLLILSNTLKANQANIPAAKLSDRAGKVELQIHSKFPNEKDYVAKAKSLSFNLKKNEALRKSVLNGSVTAEILVSMSSTQLATHELIEKREKVCEANAESRRTDWLEENKRSIQTSIGIDPNNAWVYDDDDDRMSEPDTDPPDV